MEGLQFLTLVMVALLGGVVLYLAYSLKNYQRIDHGRVLDDDRRQQQTEQRVRYLEQLLSDIAEHEHKRSAQFDEVVRQARQDFAAEVDRARDEIISRVVMRPEEADAMLLKYTGVEPGTPSSEPSHPEVEISVIDAEPDSESLVSFLRSERQRNIAELLELGYTHQDVSRMLGVSRHEIELVDSIIFHPEETRAAG